MTVKIQVKLIWVVGCDAV